MMREDKNILDSWKEIASYLDRTVKTCRKWEKELGLPIHRLDGSPKASVFAYKEELDNWLEKTLRSAAHSPQKSLLKSQKVKIGLFSIFVIAIVVCGVIFLKIFPLNQPVPASPAKPSLAILYFENNTGDKNLDHWRKMLADLLITDLMQSQYIRVLSSDALFSILNKLDLLDVNTYSEEILNKIAERGNASHILLGKYARMGETYRIDVVVKNIKTGKILSPLRVEAKGESQVFPKVDELTKGIKERFQLSAAALAGDLDREVGSITTSSPEAYRFFSEGRRFFNYADFPQCISLMEKAIEIDPDFAMAYRSLALAYKNLAMFAKMSENLEKAYQLSDRTSKKEQHIIKGEYYTLVEEDYNEAAEVYNELLRLYPDDPIGYYNLARTFYETEEWEKAVEYFELCRKYKTENIIAFERLGDSYEALGMYDKARDVYKESLEYAADEARVNARIANSYLWEGKYAKAIEVKDKTFGLYPMSWLGHIYHAQGDLDRAESEYLNSLNSGHLRSWYLDEVGTKVWARKWLAALYKSRGQFEKAREQLHLGFEQADQYDQKRWKSWFNTQLAYLYSRKHDLKKARKEIDRIPVSHYYREILSGSGTLDYILLKNSELSVLFWKGFVSIKMKSLETANTTAEELRRHIEDSPYPKTIRIYFLLKGLIELEEENYTMAIDHLKKGYSFKAAQKDFVENHALYLYPLGLSYFHIGDLENAQKICREIISLTSGRIFWGDLYAESFYLLGKIYEQKAEKAEAIEHYKRFLNLWKDADPGIEIVAEAKKNLAELKTR